MKKSYGIALVVLATIIGVGMLFFNKNEKTRVPKAGLYFLPQNSFYAIVPTEEMDIALDFYEVSKDVSLERYIDKCSGFILMSNIGEEYPVGVCKDSICDENKNIKLNNCMTARKYKVDVSVTPNRNIKITGVKFKDPKGRTTYQDIGCIEFYISTDLQGDLSVSSNRIDWESFVQPTFDHAELIVSNEEKQNVKIVNLYYGDTGIESKGGTTFEVKAKEDRTIIANVNLGNEENGKPIIYYLKPVIKGICNNKSREIVCSNVCREAYYGTSKEIREYLYKISKESE